MDNTRVRNPQPMTVVRSPATVELSRLDFGTIDEFYPDEEISTENRNQWDRDRWDWENARDNLVVALELRDIVAIKHDLETMKSAEMLWGADPLTQQVRSILKAHGIRL